MGLMGRKQTFSRGSVDLIVDAQWGSSGKGKMAMYLWLKYPDRWDASICDFNTNAGHTGIYNEKKTITQQVSMAVCRPDIPILLGPGAGITPEVLEKEIDEYGLDGRLFIHPNATVITQSHRDWEDEVLWRIASTMKGCGKALADKVSRHPYAKLARDMEKWVKWGWVSWPLEALLEKGYNFLGETSQGYELSMDSPWYPHVTSRNVNIPAILDRFGNVHPMYLNDVIATYRTFPIRVGNVIRDGTVGSSGSVYSDQEEVTWADVGVQEEMTTVTKRVRRVFTWSNEQYKASIKALRPNYIFCNFANYLDVDECGKQICYGVRDWNQLSGKIKNWLSDKWILAGCTMKQPMYAWLKGMFIGTGARNEDMIETYPCDIVEAELAKMATFSETVIIDESHSGDNEYVNLCR